MAQTSTKKLKSIFSIVLFVVILVLLFGYLYQNRADFANLFRLNTSLVLQMLFFAFCGCMMNAIYHKELLLTYNVNLKVRDWVGVVSLANVIAYVVPMRMDLIFSAAYYKKTKNLEYVKSASMAAGNIIFGVAFCAIQVFIALLCAGLLKDQWSLLLWGLCLALFVAVIGFVLFSLFFAKKCEVFLSKWSFVKKIVDGFNALVLNKALLARLLWILLLNNLFHLLLYMVCFKGIGMEVTLYEALFYSAVSRIITLVAVVPGNIGIKEMVLGIAATLMGNVFDNGIAVSLLHRVSLMSVHFALALIFAYPVYKSYNSVETIK